MRRTFCCLVSARFVSPLLFKNKPSRLKLHAGILHKLIFRNDLTRTCRSKSNVVPGSTALAQKFSFLTLLGYKNLSFHRIILKNARPIFVSLCLILSLSLGPPLPRRLIIHPTLHYEKGKETTTPFLCSVGPHSCAHSFPRFPGPTPSIRFLSEDWCVTRGQMRHVPE